MQPYANLDGESGVWAFELEPDAIIVRFNGGKTYRYSGFRPGRQHVAELKRRAVAGRGLATYISQHVRRNYDARLW